MSLSNWPLTLLTLSILVSNILAVIVASLVGLLVISGAFSLPLRERATVHDFVLKAVEYQKWLVFSRIWKAKNKK